LILEENGLTRLKLYSLSLSLGRKIKKVGLKDLSFVAYAQPWKKNEEKNLMRLKLLGLSLNSKEK